MKTVVYQKVWQYIKTMRYFSIVELYILLSLDSEDGISSSALNMYVQNLKNFEIIKELYKDTYILCKDVGILAPKIFNSYMFYNPKTNELICTNNTLTVVLSHEVYFTNKLNLYNGGNND